MRGRPRFLCFGGSDMKATTNIDITASFDTNTNPVTATEQGQTKGKPESELQGCRQASRPQPEGTGGEDGRQLRLPVLGGQLGAGPGLPMLRETGHGGAGRGPGAGHRLPPGRPRGRGEHLHPGARPGAGPDPEGTGPAGGGVGRLHVGGGAGPEEHEPGGPGAGRSGAGRSSEDRARQLRQPAGRQGEREEGEQLHPGARP